MDDERQIMRYLSWLDDLDQDFVFRDTENVVTVKMNRDELTGQSNVDNTLQYDPNVSNFDYTNRMEPYNENETILTGAMNTAQPIVIPDSYNYNNYLPNSGGFYTDPSLSQPHIPLKPSEQQYCVDMNHAVPSENSYINTSGPQLCTDIGANSTNINVSQESNQYNLPNNVDIKNNFFHEEKHIMGNDYSNNQISMNSVPQYVNVPVNTFPQPITSHEEVHCGDSSQEPMSNDQTVVQEKPFVDAVQNLNEVSTSAVIEPVIEIQDDDKVNIKTESSSEVKQEVKHEEVDLDQGSNSTSTSVEVTPSAVKDEGSVTKTNGTENEKDSNSQPIANGVDKENIEEEIEIQMCIRSGCANRAVNNPEWEQEFCSNECVIMHCRNVFTSWVKGNEIAA